MSYGVSASLSDLLHSEWQSLDASMLLQIALFHSFWCEPVLLNPRCYNRLPSQWDPKELILLWEYN